MQVMGWGQGLVRRLEPSRTRRLSPQRRLCLRIHLGNPRSLRPLVRASQLLHPLHQGRLRLRLPS